MKIVYFDEEMKKEYPQIAEIRKENNFYTIKSEKEEIVLNEIIDIDKTTISHTNCIKIINGNRKIYITIPNAIIKIGKGILLQDWYKTNELYKTIKSNKEIIEDGTIIPEISILKTITAIATVIGYIDIIRFIAFVIKYKIIG